MSVTESVTSSRGQHVAGLKSEARDHQFRLSRSPFFDREPTLEVSTGYLRYRDKYLILKRCHHESQPDTWTIPGGKIEPGESLQEGMLRELWEETGVQLQKESSRFLESFYASHTGFYYRIHLWLLDYREEEPPCIKLRPEEHSEFSWATLEGMKDLPLIAGQELLNQRVRSALPRGPAS